MRIKKTFQGNLPENTVVNTQSNSQTNAYSCEYVNKLHTYSTSEQRIGTWIDGKPVYSKTIVYNNLNLRNAETTLSINVSNGYIRFIKYGYFTMASGYRFPLNGNWTEAQAVSTIIGNNNNSILIWCDNNNTISSLTICIEYTKTTD